MLQQEKPRLCYFYGKAEINSNFVELVARKLKWNVKDNSSGIIWEGNGINEIGRREDTNQIVIRIDPRYFRPTEVDTLLGDSSKAYKKLGWTPKIGLDQLVHEMIQSDLEEARKELFLKKKGMF